MTTTTIESKDGNFPFTLRSPAQKVTRVFRNKAEVEDFLSEEGAFWRNQDVGIAGLAGGNGATQFVPLVTSRPFEDAQRSIEQPRRALEIIADRPAIFSGGTYGELLGRIRKESPELYPGLVAAVAGRIGVKWTWPDHQRLNFPMLISGLGAVLTQAERRDIRGYRTLLEENVQAAEDQRAAIEILRFEYDNWLASSHERFDAERQGFRDALELALVDGKQRVEDVLAASNTKVLELEEKIRKRLVLEAPTIYWTRKARWHTIVAGLFGVAFLAALAVGVWWVTHYGVDVVAAAYAKIVGDRPEPGLLALIPLAFITLPTLAFAWLLRHVSRVIIQNLALSADARLRGTIATTYSALTIDQAGSPAELALVLQALFRPIEGNAHAEIAPPSLQELISLGPK